MVLQSVIAGGIKRTPSSNGSNSLMWELPNPPPPPPYTHTNRVWHARLW